MLTIIVVTNYKQWSAQTRAARFREYKRAIAAGDILPPGPCEMCGQTKGTMHHAEDYGPTVVEYFAALHSLCVRCHAMLHLRFRFPGRWAEYKQLCREGPQPWALHISAVFGEANGWDDVPPLTFHEGTSWWENLIAGSSLVGNSA